METAFITGATGFIGHHVALAVLERGWAVRALRRAQPANSSTPALDVDWRTGDIRDFDRVLHAMAGCDFVFHVAADYRLWARDSTEIYETNVGGTVNVLKAALRLNVQRVVYTSSVGTLGLNSDRTPANELTPVALSDMIGHYKRSKFLAERKAEEFFSQGLPLVTVNPSTPVGAGDHKPTPTGKIIVDFLNHRMPAYLNTGLNLVHVKDVAVGHVLASEMGRVGEKYILGNRNLTLAEIFRMLQGISGVKAPRICLPYTPVLVLAYAAQALSRFTGKEPFIPFEGVKMARKYMFFETGKAVRELRFPQTPIEDALEESVRWFVENGYVR